MAHATPERPAPSESLYRLRSSYWLRCT